MSNESRRTKRRYAHELYPHAEEWQTRDLAIEVPYLYARAVGFDISGTGWFRNPGVESATRTMQMIAARKIALMADAMHQGLIGQAAWEWADSRMDDSGELLYERAAHYGVDTDKIKPYPCGPEPDHHDHYAAPDARGWQTVTRIAGAEGGCLECTEEAESEGEE